MKTLTVDLGERSYDIYIQVGLLKNRDFIKSYINRERLLVTNSTLALLYSDLILELVDGDASKILILDDGEIYKNQESLTTILTRLLELNFNRQSLLLAFGGGVIGDLVGFAASIYQRGIDFIQIPTSLLAQVDSSVGGKTAINHALGKNMIGSFHQPKAVFIDLDLLKSLPRREYLSGLAEVVKYGFIQDKLFLTWLEENAKSILALEPAIVAEMIYQSCSFKKEIVSKDERESGVRAFLNLGHTFGHAIEKNMQYQGVLHGEAVSIGIYMAAYLSYRLGMLTQDDVAYVKKILLCFGLPIQNSIKISHQAMITAMSLDKKNHSRDIRFVLLTALGEAKIKDGIDLALVYDALDQGMPKDGLPS